MRLMAREEIREQLEQVIKDGVELPALPAVVSELVSLSSTPIDKIDYKYFSDLVEKDPALMARLLQIANSAFYNVASTVTTVRHALAIIGLEEAINLLSLHLVKTTLPTVPEIELFNPEDFWSHSWACATAAKALGRPQLLVQSQAGQLYTAGLLHDIGMIVLAIHMPDKLQQCFFFSADQEVPLFEAERRIFGFDHADLGGRLLASWNIPEDILAAVTYHHCPERADPEHRELAGLIQLADMMVEQCGKSAQVRPLEHDLSLAWVVANGNTALSDATVRDKTFEELKGTFEKKTKVFSDKESPSEDVPASQNERPKRARKKKRRPVRPPGFFARLIEAIRYTFGASASPRR